MIKERVMKREGENKRGVEVLEHFILDLESSLMSLAYKYWNSSRPTGISGSSNITVKAGSIQLRAQEGAVNGIDLQAEEPPPPDRASLIIGDVYDEEHYRRAKTINSQGGKDLFLDGISLLVRATHFVTVEQSPPLKLFLKRPNRISTGAQRLTISFLPPFA